MKSVFIILGNGFTIDFLEKYNDFLRNKKMQPVRIDVQNLFRYGEVIGTPWDERPGFLSYKTCPALWTLGARPNNNSGEGNEMPIFDADYPIFWQFLNTGYIDKSRN